MASRRGATGVAGARGQGYGGVHATHHDERIRLLSLTIGMVACLGLGLGGPAAVHYSGSYGCAEDCSGHQAGYARAERHDMSDPSQCGGDSTSFIQGCMDYVEALQQELREDAGCDPGNDDCETD